jgi:hypothetical protein
MRAAFFVISKLLAHPHPSVLSLGMKLGLRNRMKVMKWVCFSAIILISFGVACAGLWFFLGDAVEDRLHRRHFEAALWRNHENATQELMWPPRLCMVDDLMRGGRLDRLSSNQVVALLGPPEEKGFPGGAKDSHLHYWLGPERGFIRIDSEWLFITFDANQKVTRYWIYRD